MDNLLFSLNATIPIFLLMIIGYGLKQIKLIDPIFSTKLNQFVFKIALPILLFYDLATTSFTNVWDTKFVLFCFIATCISICLLIIITKLFHLEAPSEFIQGSYRSSAALLGIGYMMNIYHHASYAPLMIIGAVPLYNVIAVILLSKKEKINKKQLMINIIKNPIIIGIVLGSIYSILKIPMPIIIQTTLKDIAATSTPLGLIAMGSSIELNAITSYKKETLLASFNKLILFELLFLPLAIFMGFRNEKLIAILVMLGSATTVSSFVMAKNMGHQAILTSHIVLLTTLLSSFTLTFWIYILKVLNYL